MDYFLVFFGVLAVGYVGWLLWQQFIRSQLINTGDTQSELIAKIARKLPMPDNSTLPLKPGWICIGELKG